MVVVVGTRRYRIPPERLRRYVDDLRRGGRPLRGRPRAPAPAARRGRPPAARGGRRRPVRRGDRPGRPVGRGARLRRRGLAARSTRPGWCTTCSPTRQRWPPRRAACSTRPSSSCCSWAPPPRSVRVGARWSAADAVLIDEVAGLLARPDSYGHVVLDEAQDLSAMQCRGIARRCPTRLGDRARRPGPGHHALVDPGLAGDAAPPGQAGRPDRAADPRLPGAGGRDRVRQPAAAAPRRRPGAGQLGPVGGRRPAGPRCRGAGGAAAAEETVRGAGRGGIGRRDRRRRRRRGARAGADRRRGAVPAAGCGGPADERRTRTLRPARASPWCRRRSRRASNSTTSWWSSRPRSWRPSRAGCAGSTSC